MVPPHIKKELDAYIDKAQGPGAFLYAVLSNDLMKTITLADQANLMALADICKYILSYAPGVCFGDSAAVDNWIRRGEADVAAPAAERKALRDGFEASPGLGGRFIPPR